MDRRILLSVLVAGLALCDLSTSWAAAPPVHQTLGMPDTAAADLEETDCRICHDSGVLHRHHLLTNEPIAAGSLVPVPDVDGDGSPDTIYGCLSCHGPTFTVERDCRVCHVGASPHHSTSVAQSGDCVACHGDIVDNMDDGHYIPTYAPSFITPLSKGGTGEPLNSRGNGSGACDYCHDADDVSLIADNDTLHHTTGLVEDGVKCLFCHDVLAPKEERIRTCERCHGPESLHNIQADSPNPNNLGTVVIGQEDAGFGHVGRDAGPGDSDCAGCHDFGIASAPGSGPIVPTIYNADRKYITAGTDALVVLTGASFTNIAAGVPYESEVLLTGPDGSSVNLIPDAMTDEEILVTIPGSTAPGNYSLRAIKGSVTSNPAVISIIPEVAISAASSNGTVTITGTGFGGYVEGAGISVTKTRNWGWGRWARKTAVKGKVVSWSDTEIVADFGTAPREVTVNSIYGTAKSTATSSKPGGGVRVQAATAAFGSATTRTASSKPSKAAKAKKAKKRTRGGWWWW